MLALSVAVLRALQRRCTGVQIQLSTAAPNRLIVRTRIPARVISSAYSNFRGVVDLFVEQLKECCQQFPTRSQAFCACARSSGAVQPLVGTTRPIATSLVDRPSTAPPDNGPGEDYPDRMPARVHAGGIVLLPVLARAGIVRRGLGLANHAATREATSAMGRSLSAHSQITATRQPRCLSASTFRPSRRTLPENFASQNATFVLGHAAAAHPLWRCQKQPWTKITARNFGRTRSGRPGSSPACNRKRKPAACSAALTARSGLVLELRIPDIILDRVFMSTTSKATPSSRYADTKGSATQPAL